MPNWVFNTLTIQGPKQEIDYIKDKLNKPFSVLHDTWNKDTREMELKETHYSAPVFAFWNIHSPLEEGITMEEYVQQPKRDGVDMTQPDWFAKSVEFAKTQKDWYSWNNTNWGTKWDVAVSDDNKYPDTRLEVYESEGDDHSLVYSFQTAWSPAITVLEKLSNLVPNSLLTLNFEEESGWGGEYEILRGTVTELFNYDNRCRDCDEMDTLEYCDECAIDVCSSCYDFAEANPEDVANCQTHAIYLKSTEKAEL